MFCPSCGLEYTQKTNYCKRCGEELNAAPQAVGVEPPRFRAVGMFFIVALFGIVGLSVASVADAPKMERPKLAIMFIAVALFGLMGMFTAFAMYN
jgi:phosphotransferase system  glucose/maltose/N-acetylglucosamine-specific IIC component